MQSQTLLGVVDNVFLLTVFVFAERQMTLFSVTGRDACVQFESLWGISGDLLPFQQDVGG